MGMWRYRPTGAVGIALYGVTGLRTDWAEQSIDLSQWKNQTNLRIRLHLVDGRRHHR